MESSDTVYEVRFTIGLFQSIFFYLYKIVVRVKPANVLDERSFSLARIVDYRNVFSKPAGQGRNFKASVICIGDKKKMKKKKKHLGGWQPYHRLVFRENNKIYLGINEPIRLILTSEAILMSDHIVRNKRK